MARLTPENVQRAREMIALYPKPRSALLPIFHLAQEQDGRLNEDAIAHAAELVGITPAEAYGTASFYDMLFMGEPVGRYLISICTNIACLLNGAYELLAHAEESLGARPGATTADGQFTLEEVECIALCGDPPCLTVNWRFFGRVTPESFDRLVADLRAGRLDKEVPPHGTLCRVRRTVGLTAGVPPSGRPEDFEEKAAAPASQAPAPPDERERVEAEREPVGTVATVTDEGAGILGETGVGPEPLPEGSRHAKGDTA